MGDRKIIEIKSRKGKEKKSKEKMNFNKNELINFRKRACETHSDLTTSLGVTHSTVTKWEYGLRKPSNEFIKLIAAHYSDCFNEDKEVVLRKLITDEKYE